MADILVPPQWKDLCLEALHGTIMVIGESDTGKSTLARYLYQHHCRQGRRVAYLDADIGQSTLGLPTTLNLALAGDAGDGTFPPRGPRAAYFIGDITPRGHMLPAVIGAHRLQQRALAQGADMIVVDTTGLVDKAQGGKALKQWKIELLAPTVVIGLQRARELEPILWPLRRDERVRCVELAVSPYASERSRESRIARRQEKLGEHFQGSGSRLLPLRETTIYDVELMAVSAILAFQDGDGLALGLGVVEEVDRLGGVITVRTPLAGLEGVRSVRFGAARWNPGSRQENSTR